MFVNIPRKITSLVFVIFLYVLIITGSSSAVILHPDGEPSDLSEMDIPCTSVVGRWGSNASCVAIARNLVITTIHQDGYDEEKLRTVVIGGMYYSCSEVWTTTSNYDTRIVKLNHANLSDYIGIHTSTNESGKQMRQGGFGKSRGAELGYGYTWNSESNTTLRFCSNVVDGVYSGDSRILYADFDELGYDNATEYEGIAAEYDSGSGWFIKSNNEWKLAGLTFSVTSHTEDDQSWFNAPDTTLRDPDYMFCWRVSKFASWVNSVIESESDCPYVETDLNDDCVIDLYDLIEFAEQWAQQSCGVTNNYCEGADINHDTDVDLVDFSKIAEDWLNDYTE